MQTSVELLQAILQVVGKIEQNQSGEKKKDEGTGVVCVYDGKELLSQGLPVQLNPNGAKLYSYALQPEANRK